MFFCNYFTRHSNNNIILLPEKKKTLGFYPQFMRFRVYIRIYMCVCVYRYVIDRYIIYATQCVYYVQCIMLKCFI